MSELTLVKIHCPCCLNPMSLESGSYSVFYERGEFDGNAYEEEANMDIYVCSHCQTHFGIKAQGVMPQESAQVKPVDFQLNHEYYSLIHRRNALLGNDLPSLTFEFMGSLKRFDSVLLKARDVEQYTSELTEEQYLLFSSLIEEITGVSLASTLRDVNLSEKSFGETLVKNIVLGDLRGVHNFKCHEETMHVIILWKLAEEDDRLPVDKLFELLCGERLTSMLMRIQSELVEKVRHLESQE